MMNLLAEIPVPNDLMGIPVQYQVYFIVGMQVVKWLAELYASVRNGGGLKRIITSFWFGEQLPKVIAVDYKAELTTPPFTPKDTPPPTP